MDRVLELIFDTTTAAGWWTTSAVLVGVAILVGLALERLATRRHRAARRVKDDVTRRVLDRLEAAGIPGPSATADVTVHVAAQ